MRVKGKSGNGNVSYNDLLDKPFYEGGGREIVNIPVGDIWLTKGGNFGYTNDDGSGGGVVERFNLIDKELSADKKYEVIFNEKSYICDYERISEDSLKIFNKRLQILDYYDSWGYGNQTIFDLPEKPTTPIIINEINMKQIDKKFIPTLTLENLDVSLVGKKNDQSGEIFNDYREVVRTSSQKYGNVASGNYSHSEGRSTTASGNYSHSEGDETLASGESSHAEGWRTTANGVYSHSEGYNTTANGGGSHSEGRLATANGVYSHSEGYDTTSDGDCSHSEGRSTTASGYASHSEGFNTTASGNYSHSQGYSTTASGENSFATGKSNKAGGKCSCAMGESTRASSDYQVSIGKRNIEDTSSKYLFIIGNGTNSGNSNAHTVDWSGNGWYKGKLSQEGTPTEDNDLVTKAYVDNKINTTLSSMLSFNSDGELVVTINGVSKTFVPKV